MKRLMMCLCLTLFAKLILAQGATNFNVNTCAGEPYELFAALDAGKVVVIGWTMPCASCVLPLKTTYNVVQSYSNSHPDMVQMLLADDYANTPCATINAWANSNSMTNTLRFSNAAIRMLDYGSNGMPKVVVVAGTDRRVYYNADDAVNHVELIAAIDQAISVITLADEKQLPAAELKLYPNPASSMVLLSYTLNSSSEVKIELFDQEGHLLTEMPLGIKPKGNHQAELSTSQLAQGIYLVRLRHAEGIAYQKLSIVR
jgi:hypothetical protein